MGARDSRNDDDVRFGVPLETALARRERFANQYSYDYGRERVFPELVTALLEEVPLSETLLEVGAATGLLTRSLLSRTSALTALEPSEGMLRRILASDVASDPRLATMRGMVEDLPEAAVFDVAVVTFTPRRGRGLMTMVEVLADHVRDRIIVLLDDDGPMDWTYLARSAALRCYDVRIRVVLSERSGQGAQRRAVIMSLGVEHRCRDNSAPSGWEVEARAMDVPYPAPRGAAARLVRYLLAGGDHALRISTRPEGVARLYGNLRTAVHRIARDEVTVRRTNEGIHLVRLPTSSDQGERHAPHEDHRHAGTGD
jgi:hypothetical protein